MPIAERTWFVNRLVDELKRANKQAEESDTVPLTKATHGNDPHLRQMAGLTRANPPPRGRRFT